ncbi:hypothetical protein V2S66_28130 [Streptomyces sp. V4-01]|uniref:Gram-positive cocci surface proteins LPxTG domain-containing protein n=1 Tax=Actinacidiphila polyblastidii TaxID=3110430 RepID=A0ABU7PKQ1_9ACTN|nr:hypothetical protein [Streptomyces sp. V4-01]
MRSRSGRYRAGASGTVSAWLAAAALTVLGLGAAASPAGAADQLSIAVMDLPQSYFVPVHGDTAYVPPYSVALATGSADGSGDETDLKNVTAVLDLSSLRGAVDVGLHDSGCTRQDLVVTCPLGDFYQRTDLAPLTLTATAGTPVGAAGSIMLTVTADNAPTETRSTQVVIGRPRLATARGGTTQMTSQTAAVTPEFGNHGDVAVTQGVTLHVTSQVPMAGTYRNCRYNSLSRPTTAECDFDVRLPPGAAFRTDGAFSFDGSAALLGFDVGYAVWPTGNAPEYGGLGAGAAHGTGGQLGLSAIDGGSLLDAASSSEHFVPVGGLHVDYAAVGFEIKGTVGQTLRFKVPEPVNDKHAGDDWVKPPQRLTLPAGVRALDASDVYQGEEVYCAPASGGRTATCPFGSEPFGAYVLVHLDKRVPGATGTLFTPTDTTVDPDQANNTAVVTTDITDITGGAGGGAAAGGSGAGGHSGAGGASSSGGSATGGTSGTSGAGGTSGGSGGGASAAASAGGADGGTGNLAATGPIDVPLIVGASALILAAGTVLVAVRRRRSGAA